MKYLVFIIFMMLHGAGALFAATFYSRNAGSGGDWDASASWTFSSDGTGAAAGIPGRTDDVIILAGHTIDIDATGDNGSAGVSANGLGYSNVGTYAESGTACFYHRGDVTINSGGTITASVKTMFEGYTQIDGTLSNSEDIINVGHMVIRSGATFSSDDDFICTGYSRTQIDATINSDDDIYIDHTDAKICGTGVMNVGVNSPNTPIINFINGATIAQFCSGFSITCGSGPGCSGFPMTGTGGFTFELNSLGYYKYLTIQSSQVPGDLANFPVLISFSSPDIRTVSDGGHVENANGYDIIFSSSNNCGELSQLNHQIESYSSNVTTGTIIAWVNVPAVSSSTDTEIFMYYGSSAITSDQSTGGAFDYDYVSVYHLHDDFIDGASNGIDGTNNGSTDVTGKIADGQNFVSASSQFIDLGNPAALNFATTDWTLSAWVKTTSTAQANIVSNGGDNGGGVRYVIAGNEGSANKLTLTTDDNATKRQSNSTSNINDNTWHYVVGVRDGTTLRTYVDGVAEGTNTVPGGYNLSNTSQQNAYIGCGASQPTSTTIKYFDGDIDEVRVSKVFRSPNWTATEFNNQDSPGTFFTAGVEITNTCIALPIDLLYFHAQLIGDVVGLSWVTVSEINNDFFSIERSSDLVDWETIDRIHGAGNSRQVLNYDRTDQRPLPGISYYRLKQTDFDGQFSYSNIEAIDNKEAIINEIYPQPANDFLILSLSEKISSISIYGAQGKLVYSEDADFQNIVKINVAEFKQGTYFLIATSKS
ncbi:MAG: DUF2341 domain-containing protein, partial [Vicingaceae bacterium]